MTPTPRKKNRAAVALGRRGGKVKSAAKTAHLKSIAKLGAAIRWGNPVPVDAEAPSPG